MFHVLIVDDDKIIRKGLISIIENATSEYEIVGEAPNGARALEKIKELNPDILITDIKMPVMDGIELINNIHNMGIHIYSIVLSGFDDYKYVRESMKIGAVDYLLKPVQNEDLIKCLDNIRKKIEEERKQKEKEKSYREKLIKSERTSKESILLNSVQDKFKDFKFYIEEYKNQNIEFDKSYCIFIISQDDIYKSINDGDNLDYYIYLEELKQKLYCLLKEKYNDSNSIIVKINNNTIILFFKENETSDNCFLNDIKNIIDNSNNYDISFTISQSNTFKDAINIQEAYFQAHKSLEMRFYIGKNSLIKYSELNAETSILKTSFDNQVDELINNIEICNSNNAKKIIESIMNTLYNNKTEPKLFRKTILDLIKKLIAIIPEFQFVLDNLNEEGENLQYYIESIDTFLDFKQYISNSVFDITEKIKNIRSERSKNIIEKSKLYIQEHYKENITLKDLADKVYLNPNYFSEVFKNEVGKNFIDYLIDVRINEAKKLLKKPGIKIYEVAENVGYSETISFNRAFKKIVGVPPTEYMKLIK